MKNKKLLTIEEYELPVMVEKDTQGGFVARCPQWSDCYAQGETIEEAINELSHVASSLIELYREEAVFLPRSF